MQHPSQEDEAKRAWLAKLDTPAFAAAAEAVTQVAATVSAPPPVSSAAPASGAVSEEEAKKAWLSKLEESAPSWKGVVSPRGAPPPPPAAPPAAAAAQAAAAAEEAAKRAWLAARE